MGFWKTFCTCAGCIVGAACVIATGGTAAPLVIAAAGGGVAGHLIGHKVEQEEKKANNKEKDLAIRDQTIETLKKDNEKAQTEISEKNKQLKEIDDRIQQRDQEVKKIQNKLRDPNLSEEAKKKLKNELAILLTQQEDDKKEKDGVVNTIQQLAERIKDNNKNITSVGSGSHDKNQGIWQFITLENILIVFAIYALWKIAQTDNKG